MDLPILLLADYANVERGGKLNVMGIFDRIMATGFPMVQPEMFLVMKLSASPAEYGTTRKLRVKLMNEDATEALVDWSRDIEVPEGQGQRVEINQFLGLAGTLFPAEGTYRFYVTVDNDEKGSLPVAVVRVAPEEG